MAGWIKRLFGGGTLEELMRHHSFLHACGGKDNIMQNSACHRIQMYLFNTFPD